MHKPRQVLLAYAACAVCFLALDACWLTLMTDRLYRPAMATLMRPDFDLLAAALFYPMYFAGIVGFVVLPVLAGRRGAVRAVIRGAAFGFICYATYDFTNQATLRDWPWFLTVVDIAWGCTATALASLVAWRVGLALDPDQ